MEWQPIETAPKDGTPILIYETTLGPVTYVCFWNSFHEYWVEAEGEQYSSFNPTHWMPLPEPPKT
jgi:hypothetical protein